MPVGTCQSGGRPPTPREFAGFAMPRADPQPATPRNGWNRDGRPHSHSHHRPFGSRTEQLLKAAQFSRFGGPEVLEIVDLPDPHPGPGEVRIPVVMPLRIVPQMTLAQIVARVRARGAGTPTSIAHPTPIPSTPRRRLACSRREPRSTHR